MKFKQYLTETDHLRKGTAEGVWRDLEKDIQTRAIKKDNGFRLQGTWKRFLRNQDEFNVFIVDGEWVRTNLSVIFGHGGHGWVHEFIPLNEIWVSNVHPVDCDCKNKGKFLDIKNIESTIIHEITEAKIMKDGKTPYHKAHKEATKVELKTGLVTAKEIGEEDIKI